MNNLHRELAPISESAWASIEEEARRTFTINLAGRRVVNVEGPGGLTLAAVDTGHLGDAEAAGEGVTARVRRSMPLVELRAPFTLDRQDIDDVERGAQDSNWQPVKDAARRIAFAEDRAVFEGYSAAGIRGIRESSSNPRLTLPAEAADYPDVVSQAVTSLREAGVAGPYSLLLSAAAYTVVNETSDDGYPIRRHLDQVIDGEIVWAPAIDGAFVVSARGGDYQLTLGQDLSIGYLSHDATSVGLYFQESMTFLVYTDEASVAIGAAAARGGRASRR
ncbi:MAG TPA: family 1 encapsulin nanocompartment shell protein [Streptosporangiaceae bacterium]|nr:family 1 encapsulin nanocompartment shell protein [Streptosporangiaceae bacterium]